MAGDIREALDFEVEIESHENWVDYKIYTGCAADRELFIYGSVKWDGCSNWMFNANARNSYFHACTREGLERIGQILALCWDWTAEFLPESWDD